MVPIDGFPSGYSKTIVETSQLVLCYAWAKQCSPLFVNDGMDLNLSKSSLSRRLACAELHIFRFCLVLVVFPQTYRPVGAEV